MSYKRKIKSVIPHKLLNEAKNLWSQRYTSGKQIPWTAGYTSYRSALVSKVLKDPSVMAAFKDGVKLPENFGVAMDERCVEYPWLFSQLSQDAANVLDAGSVLNQFYVINHPYWHERNLHILTLGPEEHCFWDRGISYLFDDLRDIAIRDNYYDAIVCLSTLEHVGCDNTGYVEKDAYRQTELEDYAQVMQELSRILKPGGQLFLSVPYGQYQHLTMLQQFNREMLDRAIDAFGETESLQETFYRYSASGWQLATAEECTDCEYVDWVAHAFHVNKFPKPPPVEHDRAAAARAVACIRLQKGSINSGK